MGTTCTQFRKSMKFFCSVIQGLKRFCSHSAVNIQRLPYTHHIEHIHYVDRMQRFFIRNLLIHPAPTAFRGLNSTYKHATTYLTLPLFLLTCNNRPLLRNFHKSCALDLASKFPARRRRFYIQASHAATADVVAELTTRSVHRRLDSVAPRAIIQHFSASVRTGRSGYTKLVSKISNLTTSRMSFTATKLVDSTVLLSSGNWTRAVEDLVHSIQENTRKLSSSVLS